MKTLKKNTVTINHAELYRQEYITDNSDYTKAYKLDPDQVQTSFNFGGNVGGSFTPMN